MRVSAGPLNARSIILAITSSAVTVVRYEKGKRREVQKGEVLCRKELHNQFHIDYGKIGGVQLVKGSLKKQTEDTILAVQDQALFPNQRVNFRNGCVPLLYDICNRMNEIVVHIMNECTVGYGDTIRSQMCFIINYVKSEIQSKANLVESEPQILMEWVTSKILHRQWQWTTCITYVIQLMLLHNVNHKLSRREAK